MESKSRKETLQFHILPCFFLEQTQLSVSLLRGALTFHVQWRNPPFFGELRNIHAAPMLAMLASLSWHCGFFVCRLPGHTTLLCGVRNRPDFRLLKACPLSRALEGLWRQQPAKMFSHTVQKEAQGFRGQETAKSKHPNLFGLGHKGSRWKMQKKQCAFGSQPLSCFVSARKT